MEEVAVTDEPCLDHRSPARHRPQLGGAVLLSVTEVAWACGVGLGAAIGAGGLRPTPHRSGGRADRVRRRWMPRRRVGVVARDRPRERTAE
jgi:hypothetical protein